LLILTKLVFNHTKAILTLFQFYSQVIGQRLLASYLSSEFFVLFFETFIDLGLFLVRHGLTVEILQFNDLALKILLISLALGKLIGYFSELSLPCFLLFLNLFFKLTDYLLGLSLKLLFSLCVIIYCLLQLNFFFRC